MRSGQSCQDRQPTGDNFRITARVTFNDIDDVLEFDISTDGSQYGRGVAEWEFEERY